ncbi:MAG: lipoprotein NlpD [Arenicella sp.]|jgi:lipoprotein NlpD
MVNIVNSYYLNSVLLLVTAFLLTACAPRPLVAVIERHTIDPRVEAERIGGSRIRMVQPGDTLHAIAFVNRLNVNKLAAWNRLADTSRLNIGQRIRLTRPLNFDKSIAPRPSAKPLNDKPIVSKPLRTNNNINSRASVAEKAPSTVFSKQPVTWEWPTQGKLIGYFSASSGNQGIDIQGKIGQNVSAASAGQVVYVGNGLKGYGNLVIIKHSEQFLSAYAHNQKLYVQEGQAVNTSQRIASLGRDNMRRDALHFQIRKNGQPVNPLSYLPRR